MGRRRDHCAHQNCKLEPEFGRFWSGERVPVLKKDKNYWVKMRRRLQFPESSGIVLNRRELQFPEGLELASDALYPIHLPVSNIACEIQPFSKL